MRVSLWYLLRPWSDFITSISSLDSLRGSKVNLMHCFITLNIYIYIESSHAGTLIFFHVDTLLNMWFNRVSEEMSARTFKNTHTIYIYIYIRLWGFSQYILSIQFEQPILFFQIKSWLVSETYNSSNTFFFLIFENCIAMHMMDTVVYSVQ